MFNIHPKIVPAGFQDDHKHIPNGLEHMIAGYKLFFTLGDARGQLGNQFLANFRSGRVEVMFSIVCNEVQEEALGRDSP